MPGYLTTGALRPNVVVIGVPTDLRPVAPSSLFIDGMTALAVATGGLFAWDSASLTPDDGATVIKPDDLGVIDPGRWKKVILAAPAQPPPLLFGLVGPYNDANVPGTFDPPVLIEMAATINTVSLLRRDPGTAGNTTIDVLVNGSSIFALPVDRPTVSSGAGSFATDSKVPTVGGVLTPGDIVEVYLVDKETGDATRPQGIRVAINLT